MESQQPVAGGYVTVILSVQRIDQHLVCSGLRAH
jgi:hypothetical protein